MPINSKSNTHSFTEKYYLDKFSERRAELFKSLEKNPNNLVAKEQIQFINDLLKEGSKGEWPAIWKKWEEDNFYWPDKK